MDYSEALKAYQDRSEFTLPAHGDASYSPQAHESTGTITTLGHQEAELICGECGTHFLGALANLEVPEEITVLPAFHIVT